jgi:SulP family sulfate permease
MGALGSIAGRARVVILRMDQVPTMDSTGLVALESALDRLRANKCLAIISGLREQPAGVLSRSQARRQDGSVVVCPDIESALRIAEQAALAVNTTASDSKSKPPG